MASLLFEAAPSFALSTLDDKLPTSLESYRARDSKSFTALYFFSSKQVLNTPKFFEDNQSLGCNLVGIYSGSLSVEEHLAVLKDLKEKKHFDEIFLDSNATVFLKYDIYLKTPTSYVIVFLDSNGVIWKIHEGEIPEQKEDETTVQDGETNENKTLSLTNTKTLLRESVEEEISKFKASNSTASPTSLTPTSNNCKFSNSILLFFKTILNSSKNAGSKLIDLCKFYFAEYNNALRTSPLKTKAITSSIISILGELTSSWIQKTRGKSRSLPESLHRIIVFGTYGLFLTGPVFNWWYAFLEKTVKSFNLPPSLSTIIKIALDRLVITPPFLLFTLAYLNFFLTFDREKTIQIIKRNFAVSLFTNWKVWTPAQVINFQLVPFDFRVLFGNCVALWWNVYLSLINA